MQSLPITILAALACSASATALAGEVIYNGIKLPDQWPPKIERLTREPMPVPYLDHPPAVILIDVGRQLFVDDFLIERTTLKRTFHRAKYHTANPILKPDKPWEQRGQYPTAMPFSDGVWYDSADKLFKMWYMGGYCLDTCYVESKDGVHWTKPSLDIESGTNIVLKTPFNPKITWYPGGRDSNAVWLDHQEQDTSRRFKMLLTMAMERNNRFQSKLFYSPDGIHWSESAATSPAPKWNSGDRNTFFYNPFRKVWVYNLRRYFPPPDVGRARIYREHADLAAGLNWRTDDLYLWLCSDRLDPHNPNPARSEVEPELYAMDAIAYESLILGQFAIWQGDPGQQGQKRNEVLLGFSRDGFHWHRPDRLPFIPVNEKDGAWNWANIQTVCGGCLIVGDKLYFYVSARERDAEKGPCSTGLAVLRRDGFASLDSRGEEGSLLTRPVLFTGRRLFVNADSGKGQLLAEILDQDGKVIEPFSKANCVPISADKTQLQVRWKGAADFSDLSGKPVRFRFTLHNGSLFSFWVSPDASGASRGYVAAGGPGFLGPTDTVGQQGE